MDINKQENQRAANILNDLVLMSIFIISVINIVISSFGIQHVDLSLNNNIRNNVTLLFPKN